MVIEESPLEGIEVELAHIALDPGCAVGGVRFQERAAPVIAIALEAARTRLHVSVACGRDSATGASRQNVSFAAAARRLAGGSG
jgi:hypothetical protein